MLECTSSSTGPSERCCCAAAWCCLAPVQCWCLVLCCLSAGAVLQLLLHLCVPSLPFLPPAPPPALCRYDVLSGLRPGGTVLINAPWKTFEEVEKYMPLKTKARLAALRPKVGLQARGRCGRVLSLPLVG